MRIGPRLLAAAVLAVGLAGCGGNPEPAPLPSPSGSSSSPSPSGSSSPSAEPSLPPEAQGTTKKSARAFVRFYVEQVNLATESGDTKLLRQLGVPACKPCNELVEFVDSTYAAGGWIRGPAWRVDRITTVSKGPDGKLGVIVYVDTLPQRFKKSRKTRPKQFPGGTQQIKIFTVIPQGANWRILTYYIQEEV